MEETPWTLYVAKDKKVPSRHDAGSVLCLDLLTLVPQGAVNVVECCPSSHPSFIDGTPSLIADEARALTGTNAIRRLQDLAIYHAELRGGEKQKHEKK